VTSAGRDGATDGFDDFVGGGLLVGRFIEEGEEDCDGRQARDRLGKGSVVLALFHVDHGGMVD
jgi:hypothetical protein